MNAYPSTTHSGNQSCAVASFVRNVGNTGSPARITLVTPALLSLAMMVRASCCAVVRSSEYGTVVAGFTPYVAKPLLEVLHALGERARVVVVVDDAEHASLRLQRVARVRGLALGELLADERGPVLARLLG